MTFFRKLLQLLDSGERLRSAYLLGLMAIGAALEAIGISLIMPFLALVVDPESAMAYPVMGWLLQAAGNPTPAAFVLYAAALLVVFHILKGGFLSYLFAYQYRFIYDKQAKLAQRLFDGFLRSPLSQHLERNSAEVLRNITSEVLVLCTQILLPVAIIFVEGLVILAIGLLLLSVEPVGAVVAIAFLGGACGLFYRAIRTRALQAGQEKLEHHVKMLTWVNQGAGAVREIKAVGSEPFFGDRFAVSNRGYADALRYSRLIGELPRIGIELLAVVGISIVVAVVAVGSGDTARVMPVLAVFGLAAVRVLPSVNRIISALTSLRYHGPSLDAVHDDLVRYESAAQSAGGNRSERELRDGIDLIDVDFNYPGAKGAALDGINLRISHGDSVALVGPSGSGKSTLVSVLLGLISPTSGRMEVDGTTWRFGLDIWGTNVGFIPQPIYLIDDTIRRNVAFAKSDDEIDDDRVWEVLRDAQLEEFVDALPDGLDTRIAEHGAKLSGGQRQRIGLARALYDDPPLLVFDEPTSALDRVTEADVAQMLERVAGGRTMIVIAHRLETVRGFERLVVLDDGVITGVGSFRELSESSQAFRKMIQADPGELSLT